MFNRSKAQAPLAHLNPSAWDAASLAVLEVFNRWRAEHGATRDVGPTDLVRSEYRDATVLTLAEDRRPTMAYVVLGDRVELFDPTAGDVQGAYELAQQPLVLEPT